MRFRLLFHIFVAALVMALAVGSAPAAAQGDNPEVKQEVGTPAHTPTPTLAAPCGPLTGLLESGISVYKGIPYAKPPMGELRFAPPQRMEPWKETFKAENFGNVAVQQSIGMSRRPRPPMSEDCLSLNIWTPAKAGDGQKLPVYVFIHGGAYAFGSSADGIYDGTAFARDGVVAVTINYRLNALGFLATRETLKNYGTTGNWGHLDQIMALEWIRDNIAAFGGDPQKVTIGGESAGSYSVSALVLSPLAKGLFQGAIMESGTVLSVTVNNFTKGDMRRSFEQGDELARVFNTDDSVEGLAVLRAADAEVIAQLSQASMNFNIYPKFVMMPVFDNKVLPQNPVRALDEGRFNKVRVLFGYNADEGSMFLPPSTNEVNYKTLAHMMFGPDAAASVLKRFPVDAENNALQRARQVFAFSFFTSGMKVMADAMAASGLDVYGYYFSYISEKDGKRGLGARHAAEMGYIFDSLPFYGYTEPAPAQVGIAKEMHSRVVNFIKNGDPNQGETVPSAVAWPKYSTDGHKMLRFDSQIEVIEMPDLADIDFMGGILRNNFPFSNYEPVENYRANQ